MKFEVKCAALAVSVVALCSGASDNIININDGQVLNADDLLAGVFNGSSFTIDGSLVININNGGTMGSVDERLGDWAGFQLSNATININSGGRLEGGDDSQQSSTTILSRTRINLYKNGSIGNILIRGNNPSLLNFYGGLTEQVNVDSPGRIQVYGGTHSSLGGFAQAHNPLTTEIFGGDILGIGLRGNDRIELRGGTIHSIGAVGGEMHLYGDELILDGVAIELALNETIELNYGIFDFDILSGTLEDGSYFEFDQYSDDIFIGATTDVFFTRTVPASPTASVIACCLLISTKRRR